MNNLFQKDWARYKHSDWQWTNIIKLAVNQNMRYMYTGRMGQTSGILSKIFGLINKHQGKKMGNEICFKKTKGVRVNASLWNYSKYKG